MSSPLSEVAPISVRLGGCHAQAKPLAKRRHAHAYGDCTTRRLHLASVGRTRRCDHVPEPLESQMSKINTIALVPTILAFTLVAQTAAALLIVG